MEPIVRHEDRMTDVLLSLTYEDAKTHVGENFQIRFSDATVDLSLEEVILLAEKHVNPRMKRDAFSMQFRGPRDIKLKQSIYPMFNERLGGPLSIFLVPIGTADPGFLYEAVFT